MGSDWSDYENDAIVADYFDMLSKELAGVRYNKTEHRRRLSRLLNRRTDGSIELKHQNISAILDERGVKWINGYKPRFNYQFALFEAVVARIETAASRTVMEGAESLVGTQLPTVQDVLDILVQPPTRLESRRRFRERPMHPYALPPAPSQPQVVDYLQREAARRDLGLAGEELALRFEHARLLKFGAGSLAEKIEHVSKQIGDSEGFDILSYEPSGQPRLIEVKTTNHSRDTPFFLSKNEVQVSRANEPHYHLYRIYSFKRSPQMFTLPGALTESCILDPTHFMAIAS